ncbi:MAG: cyclic nucleotide-binding domain-containing protein [Gammaproteobacteria bacterium]|nr:cyclic nucleotide-binding domain-containing protein [Gammaproteobacteria bacterium]
MFERLGPIQLAAIAQYARERFVPRGTTIKLGKRAEEVVLSIVDGELEAAAAAGSQRFGSGDVVGFVEQLSEAGTELVLTATTDTMTLEFDWDAQLEICEEHFAVVMRYVEYLARQVVELAERVPASETGAVALLEAQEFGKTLDLNERLLLLSRCGEFSSGCLDALSELGQHAVETHWRKGKKIWSAGQTADHFFLIASGSVLCRADSGAERVYRPGAVIGMHEALSGSRRQATAESTEKTLALRIDLEPFTDILEDHFDLSLDVLSMLATKLDRIQNA